MSTIVTYYFALRKQGVVPSDAWEFASKFYQLDQGN